MGRGPGRRRPCASLGDPRAERGARGIRTERDDIFARTLEVVVNALETKPPHSVSQNRGCGF